MIHLLRRFALALVAISVASPLAAQEIDVDRLMTDLQVIAADSMQGRRVGTPGSAAARAYIVERLNSLQIPVDSQVFEVTRGGQTVQGINVAAMLPGTSAGSGDPDTGAFAITAHYDHLGTRGDDVFNGADDNGSGTAALLSLAEALRDRPLRRTVVLVFFDAEEGGLDGARTFVERAGADLRSEVALNLNLDMVSRSEEELWVAGTYQNPALKSVVEGVEAAPGVVLRLGHDSPAWQGSDNWTTASDHGPFHQAGIPFLYFGVEDHPDYHRASDTADTVDPVWYDASVETILGVVRALDDAPDAVEAARSAKAR